MILSPILVAIGDNPRKQKTTCLFLLPQYLQELCKRELLLGLQNEKRRTVSRPLSDTVAETFRRINMWNLQWPEILPVTFEFLRSQDPLLRESGFYLMESASNAVAKQVDLAQILPEFDRRLGESEVVEVRLACLKAVSSYLADSQSVGSFLQDGTESGHHSHAGGNRASHDHIARALNNLMRRIVQLLQHFEQNLDSHGSEDALSVALMALVELAGVKAKLFRPILQELLQLTLELMKDPDNPERLPNSALELMLTLVENATAMVRSRLPNLCAEIIPLCMRDLMLVEDDESWYSVYETLEDNGRMAQQALDRLALELRGKHVLPVAFRLIPQMLASNRWQDRHAALSTLSYIAEGCRREMEQELDRIMTNLVLPYLKDPHPRVRYAALNTVGQMCSDFQNDLQNQFSEAIIEGIVPLLEDQNFPRVQAHAAAALRSFCGGARAEQIEPYLDRLIRRFMFMLQNGKVFVQEQTLTTLASIAHTVDQSFATHYYSDLMPLLIQVSKEAVSKEFETLRGRALECISLIALAVGRQTFEPHAQLVLEILVALQQDQQTHDEFLAPYLAATWARMCKVLGHDFHPYLDLVMPPLLESANQQPEFKLVDPDEDASQYDEVDGWEILVATGQRVAMRTSVLEDKHGALEKLNCYAQELEGSFSKYTKQVHDIVLPLLRFWHFGIREAAADIVPMLFTCAVQGGYSSEDIRLMWEKTAKMLTAIISEQTDTEVIEQMYMSYSECVDILGPNCLTSEQIADLCNGCVETLQVVVERGQDRNNQLRDPDCDAEEQEVLFTDATIDERCLTSLCSTIEHVLKATSGSAIDGLGAFIHGLPDFVKAYDAVEGRKFMHSVFNTLIRYAGPRSFAFRKVFADPVLHGIQDPDQEVRQLSCVGIGDCAQYGGPEFKAYCEASVEGLIQLVRISDHRGKDSTANPTFDGHADPDSEERISAEQAVVALGKIGKYLGHDTAMREWYAGLPVVQVDSAETYSTLLAMVQNQHPVVFAHDGNLVDSMVRLVKVIVKALRSRVLHDDVGLQHGLAAAVKHVVERSPEVRERLRDTDTEEVVRRWRV